MKPVITDDGSVTFFNEAHQEHYHSKTGAREEAFKKYIEPCAVAELAKNRHCIKILDFCFGLGYNTAAAIDTIWKANPLCHIEIIALERDVQLLESLKKLSADFMSYKIIQATVDELSYDDDNISLTIIPGDAAQTLLGIDQFDFDVVFFDPFSPKKQPELWSEDIFTNIYIRMREGGVLATYSCAAQVRTNLKNAGFIVKDGPPVGRRGPSTLAIK